jgi:hypothetical protein
VCCLADLRDLTKYSSTPKDGGVIAWPVVHSAAERDAGSAGIIFKIKAQVLKKAGDEEEPKAAESPKAAAPGEETDSQRLKDEL